MRKSLPLGLLSLLLGLGSVAACGADVQVDSLFASGGTTGSSVGGAGGQGGVGGVGGAGGQGGVGAQGGQGGAASSSSAVTGTGPSSSSAGTGGQGGQGGGFDPEACGQCSFGNCQAEIFACGQACQGFLGCAQNCADSLCVDDCLTQYPQAEPVYDCTCASCSAQCGSFCDGAGGGSSSSSSTTSSSASGTGGGGGACSTCSEILQGGMNTPCDGSAALLGALFNCTCQQSCVNECSGLCQGGQPSQACFGCVQQGCGQELNACLQD
ncbi:hypothetical protein [Polyangium spumosum]|uniref:PE-PGRS family protein n=1 Tax=Polyangium spumosum TaxID=889282 RepID=A0A6N7PRU0_9BACT|nr:hypothetical protein [Polyangium spumosum]MRG94768.1 hypothetical protein [Polyangium spumosum]